MSYLLNYKNWRALYESQTNIFEDGEDPYGGVGMIDDTKIKDKGTVDPFADMPKEGKKRLEYLVNKAGDLDSQAIKKAGAAPATSLLPYDAITDWMITAGKPTTRSDGKGGYKDFSPEWKKRFKDREPSMKLEDCIQCMQYWNGIIDTTKTKKETIEINGKPYDVANYDTARVIRQLDQLSNLKKVKSLVEEAWKAKGIIYFNTGSPSEYEFEGTKYSIEKDKQVTFDPNLIVEKSKILLEKAKKTFVNTGKTRRNSKTDMLSPNPNSDNVWFDTGEGGKYYSKKSRDQTGSFWLWYQIISDDARFQKLLARFDDPTYVRTVFTKMTEQDKINIIKGISDAAQKKFEKGSVGAMEGIYGATSIVWWPVEAKETMPKTTVLKPASPGIDVEYENEWDFSWPYAKEGGVGKELAMTYFKSDSAIIQDGKDKEIDNAVKQIMAEIKSKNGTLKSLKYRVVASTSDEPSKYASPNKVAAKYDIANNQPLVRDRAKVIETALTAAITANGIDPTLVTKDGEDLTPNNILDDGSAKYQEKKWMRLDHKDPRATAATDAEYKALFAKPKHSGLLFNIVYTTIEKEKSEPTPEETTVSDYEVVGEWLFEIKWAGGGSYKKKRRRTHTRRPMRGIPWDKLFPPLPAGGGWSVEDLCDAYGRSGPG
jgi:hypothetical protein